MTKVLITGCPRSGTTYTSEVLQAAGLKIGHETPGRDGIVTFAYHTIASSDWRDIRREYPIVLHQVRHPVDCIASFATLNHKNIEKMLRYFGCECDGMTTLNFMRTWYLWNVHAEIMSDWTYRVETIEHDWCKLCCFMGVNVEFPPNIPTNINARPHEEYTWETLNGADDFLARRIAELARWYGYPCGL